jgi:hypothetical protein
MLVSPELVGHDGHGPAGPMRGDDKVGGSPGWLGSGDGADLERGQQHLRSLRNLRAGARGQAEHFERIVLVPDTLRQLEARGDQRVAELPGDDLSRRP